MASEFNSEVANISLKERERILADKETALFEIEKDLDEREKKVYSRENSFELQSLEQEWDRLWEKQREFYKTGPGLTSFDITKKKQKLQLKKQQLKRLHDNIKAKERELRLGILYPRYSKPYTCQYCGTDNYRNGEAAEPSPDEFSEDSE